MKKTMVYTRRLEEAGVSRKQAEAHLEVLEEVIEMDLATKADIKELQAEIAQLDQKMERGFIELKYEMTLKLGMINLVSMLGLATFFKFIL